MDRSFFRQLLNTKSKAPFWERLMYIDFKKIYTPKIRLLCHLLMWMSLSLFILLNLVFGYKFSFKAAIVFTLRSLVANALVFYLFFYLFAPRFFFRGKILLTFCLLIICVYVWVIADYYFMSAIYHLKIQTGSSYHQKAIEKVSTVGFRQIADPKAIISNVIVVLYSISPFFFTKVLFDLARIFSSYTKAEKQKAQLQIDNVEIEKEFLKAQLNPHFLFNTLNNLYGMVVKKSDAAPEAIMQLSQMMRYSLYECNAEKVPLSQEIAFIKNYVALEKLRYGSGRHIRLEITGDPDNLYIAPLLTFTFIENAFKYGLQDKNEGFIEININISEKTITFSAANDIWDNTAPSDPRVGGIGIVNVKKRLGLLYPGKYELILNKLEYKFSIMMKIDLS